MKRAAGTGAALYHCNAGKLTIVVSLPDGTVAVHREACSGPLGEDACTVSVNTAAALAALSDGATHSVRLAFKGVTVTASGPWLRA